MLAAAFMLVAYALPEHFRRFVASYMTGLTSIIASFLYVRLFVLVVFGFGMFQAVAVPLLLAGRTLDHRAALTFIFNMTVISNSGTLRFMPNVILNLAAVLVWIVASHIAVFGNQNVCHSPQASPSPSYSHF